jgi:hypothetical protein
MKKYLIYLLLICILTFTFNINDCVAAPQSGGGACLIMGIVGLATMIVSGILIFSSGKPAKPNATDEQYFDYGTYNFRKKKYEIAIDRFNNIKKGSKYYIKAQEYITKCQIELDKQKTKKD